MKQLSKITTIKVHWNPKNYLPILISLLILVAAFSYTFSGLVANANTLNEDNKSALIDFSSALCHGITLEFTQFQEFMLKNWLDVNNMSDLFNYNRYLSIISIYYNYSQDIYAINWINSTGFIKWVYPYDQNSKALGKNVEFLANGDENTGFIISKTTNQTGFTNLVPLFQGGVGFAAYIPIIYNSTITGYFNIVFEIHSILHKLISYEYELSKFSYLVTQNNISIYSNIHFSYSDSFVVSTTVTIFTMTWEVYSRPLANEIWDTSIASVIYTLIFEVIFCMIIFIITSFLKQKNDLIKKQYEDREKIMDNLVQDKKLKALGSLAAGIAHDFNNILTGMTGQLKLAEDEITQNNIENFNTVVNSLQKSVTRSKNLVDQILIFSRNKKPIFKILNIKDVALDTINLIKESSTKMIQIISTIEDNLFLYGDQTQLVQIIINIILNSINAIDINQDPKITITIYRDDENYNNYLLSTIKKENPQITYKEKGCIIKIKDNGKGMSQEQIKNAFDPFSSFKSTGKGSGLGLGIVHNNVSSLGGTVSIKSQLGSFTELEVKLPLVVNINSTGLTMNTQSVQTINQINLTGKTIFLIDDEPDIVTPFGLILEKFGATILRSTNGVHAWEIFQKDCDRIDLVIVDINMPGLSGQDIVHLFKVKKPDQKFIFMTGHSNELLKEEQIVILWKPFSIADLLAKISSELELSST